MPWELNIHLLDVGQGDSTLIVARDTAPGGRSRSMLIDGGLRAYGKVVDDYIVHTAGLPRLDHIVASHYDADHHGGLEALLLADDLSDLVRTLTTPAVAAALHGGKRAQRIASTVAAVYAVAIGNYGANAAAADLAAADARTATVDTGNDVAAASEGVKAALARYPANPQTLISNPTNRRNVAKAAGSAVARSIDKGHTDARLTDGIVSAVLGALRGGMMVQGAGFWTGNRYNGTHVIDLGAVGQPDRWAGAISGSFMVSGSAVRAPGVHRMRTSAAALALGSEVLWNSGPNAMLPPAGAPRVYLIGRNGRIWQGEDYEPVLSSLADDGKNNCSIGLLICFNNFVYYTFGDMAQVGEDAAITAITARGLPDPAGGTLPVPPRMSTFKCSHHGAGSSTSDAFLAAARPKSALISCGANASYMHPDQDMVARLHDQWGITAFYMTNCSFPTAYVPASMRQPQLRTGNKSRVAGDNSADNLGAGRNRGDIRLRVGEAESVVAAAGAARWYTVQYWENTQVPPCPMTVVEYF